MSREMAEPQSIKLKTRFRWGRLFTANPQLALLDQCLVSGNRFMTTWFVGRLAGPEALGTYSIAMALIMLAGVIQEALIVRPYQTFRFEQSTKDRALSAGSAIAQTLGLALCGLVVLLVLAGAFQILNLSSEMTGGLLTVAAVIIPGTLIGEFTRRYALAGIRLRMALVIDAILAGGMFCGLLLLGLANSLSAYSTLAMIGLVNMVVGTATLYRIRSEFAWERIRFLQDTQQSWRFGKWLCCSQMLGLAHGYLVPWLVAFSIGMDAAGKLSACYTLVLFSNPVILGFSAWLGPLAARTYTEDGLLALRRLLLKMGGVLGVCVLLYWCALVMFGELLIVFVFGEEYKNLGPVVGFLGSTAFGFGLSVSGTNGLAAIRRPSAVLAGPAIGMCLTLSSYYWLVTHWQLAGAAAALALGSLVAGTIQFVIAQILSPATSLAPPVYQESAPDSGRESDPSK